MTSRHKLPLVLTVMGLALAALAAGWLASTGGPAQAVANNVWVDSPSRRPDDSAALSQPVE